jgi:acetyltransferase-like isoleucine patch superfamily enzyme
VASLLERLEAARSALWLRKCTEVGPGVRLSGRPYLWNEGQIRIGTGVHLSSRPVISHLVTGPRGRIEISDRVSIGYGAAIASQGQVRIGSGTRIGPFLVLADTDFHVVGDRDAAPEARPVEIGRDVQIGARVSILPGSTIGDGARVCAGSTVAGTVVAGTVVAGVPARVGGGAEASNSGASLPERVQGAVARALGLPGPPGLSQGPGEIPEWDSLGALRLLLVVEDDFGIHLGEQDMVRIRRVADLVSVVEARVAHASPR